MTLTHHRPTPAAASRIDPQVLRTTLEGVLRHLPGYEPRPQQVEMAESVASALNERHHLMVEAGTGCGKTMAYLVPLLLSGKRVVVSTHTLALQSQLVEKDLLFLRRVFPRPFKFAMAKGRGNYLCPSKLIEAERFVLPDSPDHATLKKIREKWLNDEWEGDVGKLDFNVNPRFWAEELASQSEECHSGKCVGMEKCCFRKARRSCEEADIIVANHALYFMDLITGGAVLPPHDIVIFDEAHHLEDVATRAFAVEIPRWSSRNLLTKIERRTSPVPPRIRHQLMKSDDNLLEWVEKQRWRNQLLRGEDDLPVLAAEYSEALTQLSMWLKEMDPQEIKLFSDSAEGAKTQAKVYQETLMTQVAGLKGRWLHFADLPTEEEGYVTWLETDRRRDVYTLNSAPLNVSEILSERLWPEKQAILTSATLAVNGKFDYIRARLGLGRSPSPRPSATPLPKGEGLNPEVGPLGPSPRGRGVAEGRGEGEPLVAEELPVDELLVGSPFNYEEQALLFFPRHLPEPNDPGYNQALCPVIEELLDKTQGRAFVLFTSYRSLREVAETLRPRLPFPCKSQEEMPRDALLEWFRSTPHAVLFATSSFWEGVDVPGQALSCVIIDKMPFAHPDDPVVQATTDALKRAGRDWFNEYSLPKAILTVKQGFGRLIRTRNDRGIVALCDPRLLVKPYGKTVVWSLPRAKRIFSLDGEEVERLLEEEKGANGVGQELAG
ncbi:MAG: hypothetical protein KY468_02720 [Armatimonadetes bacterium]|nr:hypothetical protein [Armatimonadota bacterium]